MSIKLAEPKKSIIGVGDNNRKEHGNRIELDGKDELDGSEVDGDKIRANDITKKKNYSKTSKFKKLFKPKKKIGSLDFLILRARLVFTKLRQAFVRALILYYFDPECYIQIKTNALCYAIDGVFSQLISDNLS